MQPPPDEDVGCGSASKGGLARVGYPWDRWARPISHHQFSPLHVSDSRFKRIACTGVLAAIKEFSNWPVIVFYISYFSIHPVENGMPQ